MPGGVIQQKKGPHFEIADDALTGKCAAAWRRDILPAVTEPRAGSERYDWNAESLGGQQQSVVVARQLDRLPLKPQELDGCKMQRIEGADRNGKRLQGPREDWRDELDQSDASDKKARILIVRFAKPSRMQSSPYLVFQKAAGDQRLLPQGRRWRAIFCEDVRQSDRSIEVDQRPSRSSPSSRMSSLNFATGRRGGTPEAASGGGVTHPFRTASAKRASAGWTLRPGVGGTNSATTRLRSVTSTVSPAETARRYSLSSFLRALMPTTRIKRK
jgi:hypothetical protein